MDELQEMREQLAALKEKLNKQEIISEKLLKETIARKMKRAKVWVLVSVIMLIILTAMMLSLNYIWFENKAFSPTSIVFALVALPTIILGVVQLFKLKPKKIATATLGEVASQLQRTKEFEQGNFTFWMAGIPSIIVSIYFIMIYVHSKSNVILLCVVAYILLAIWSYVTRKKQRKSKRSAWDEYIRQIEEMSELDEGNDKAEAENDKTEK
jgi:cytochrome c-type biogenesis protein CcmH/NrfG